MNPLAIKDVVSREMKGAFDIAGELVRSCLVYKTESPATTGLLSPASLSASTRALFVDYHSQDIDGSAVLVGDEKAFVLADEISEVSPAAGDTVLEVLSGIRREVIAARMDPSDSFWVLQVRQFFNEDWSDLARATVLEDWGNLTTADLFDDWQSN